MIFALQKPGSLMYQTKNCTMLLGLMEKIDNDKKRQRKISFYKLDRLKFNAKPQKVRGKIIDVYSKCRIRIGSYE